MGALYYFSLLRKNAVHKCKSGLLGVKKWHIGRFDGQQKTLPKQRNMPVAPYRVEGRPLVYYYMRLNDWLAYIS